MVATLTVTVDEHIPAPNRRQPYKVLCSDETATVSLVFFNAKADYLEKLLPIQRKDFEGIFEAMHGLPVTVRLLAPPLHEFVPHDDKGQKEMAKVMGVDVKVIKHKVEDLSEVNPMLGHRGCRLGNTYPLHHPP